MIPVSDQWIRSGRQPRSATRAEDPALGTIEVVWATPTNRGVPVATELTLLAPLGLGPSRAAVGQECAMVCDGDRELRSHGGIEASADSLFEPRANIYLGRAGGAGWPEHQSTCPTSIENSEA